MGRKRQGSNTILSSGERAGVTGARTGVGGGGGGGGGGGDGELPPETKEGGRGEKRLMSCSKILAAAAATV